MLDLNIISCLVLVVIVAVTCPIHVLVILLFVLVCLFLIRYHLAKGGPSWLGLDDTGGCGDGTRKQEKKKLYLDMISSTFSGAEPPKTQTQRSTAVQTTETPLSAELRLHQNSYLMPDKWSSSSSTLATTDSIANVLKLASNLTTKSKRAKLFESQAPFEDCRCGRCHLIYSNNYDDSDIDEDDEDDNDAVCFVDLTENIGNESHPNRKVPSYRPRSMPIQRERQSINTSQTAATPSQQNIQRPNQRLGRITRPGNRGNGKQKRASFECVNNNNKQSTMAAFGNGTLRKNRELYTLRRNMAFRCPNNRQVGSGAGKSQQEKPVPGDTNDDDVVDKVVAVDTPNVTSAATKEPTLAEQTQTEGVVGSDKVTIRSVIEETEDQTSSSSSAVELTEHDVHMENVEHLDVPPNGTTIKTVILESNDEPERQRESLKPVD